MEISLALAIYILGVTSGALVTVAFYHDRKKPAPRPDEPSESGVWPL